MAPRYSVRLQTFRWTNRACATLTDPTRCPDPFDQDSRLVLDVGRVHECPVQHRAAGQREPGYREPIMSITPIRPVLGDRGQGRAVACRQAVRDRRNGTADGDGRRRQKRQPGVGRRRRRDRNGKRHGRGARGSRRGASQRPRGRRGGADQAGYVRRWPPPTRTSVSRSASRVCPWSRRSWACGSVDPCARDTGATGIVTLNALRLLRQGPARASGQ